MPKFDSDEKMVPGQLDFSFTNSIIKKTATDKLYFYIIRMNVKIAPGKCFCSICPLAGCRCAEEKAGC